MKRFIVFLLTALLFVSTAYIPAFAAEERGLLLGEGQSHSYIVTTETDGEYKLSIEYMAMPGRQISPQVDVTVSGNGQAFSRRIELTRFWKDDTTADRFDTDVKNNEIVPDQVEQTLWQTMSVGFNKATGGAAVALKKGEYKVDITVAAESVRIDGVSLATTSGLSYEEYLKGVGESSSAATEIFTEAELTSGKSHSSIIPTYDRSNYSVSPNFYDKISLNIIGGTCFSEDGQWVEWEIDAPESALYSLSFRYYQNGIRGLGVGRSVLIDGQLPYAELGSVLFPYCQNFKDLTPSDDEGNPYLVYLEKGSHTLRLQVSVTHIEAETLKLEGLVQECNKMYREIVEVTGTAPDVYRDYYLDTEIPGLIPFFEDAVTRLTDIAEAIDKNAIDDGSETSVLYEMVRVLEKFIKRPDKIAESLNDYKTQIDSLASTMLTLKSQPLVLDYITLTPENQQREAQNSNFFTNLVFRLKLFLHSFVSDYGTYTNGSKGQIDVWVNSGDLLSSGTASGRDQMQIIRRLSDSGFTTNTGVGIKLSLVSAGESLIKAILADRGPDVALFVDETTIANLAIRGAIVDMTGMEDYKDARSEYPDSAFIAYTFGKGVYAWPITQNYSMMFYRTDIFGELGLSAPNTWDEFNLTIQKLAQHNFQVGVGAGQDTFEMFLLQAGGNIYTDDLKGSGLKEPQAVEAFTRWTNLFIKQGIPLAYDFLNRFRTGEMPLAISGYTTYNQLVALAPEITGQWEMVPIPGTYDEQGNLNRTQSSNVTGAIIVSDTDNLKGSYEFIKWWASSEVQTPFGIQSEAILGKAARYNTANTVAFSKMNWTTEESRQLLTQWASVTDIPQTGASYYVARCITNAYRRAVYDYENVRDVIYRYSDDIDREIKRKLEQIKW